MAAVEYFLQLDGIKGGSNDAKHADEIDVDGFGWGVSQAAGAATGAGGRAGKAQLAEFSFTTRTSIASPALFVACASGQHIKDAIFTARHAGGSEFLRIAFADVVVASYEIEGTELEPPIDTVTLSFGRVEIEYRTMLPTGAAGPVSKAGWDVRSGKKF